MIGKILSNRYKIVRELGSGGMAWVYLGEDVTEGREVAIKVLYPQFSEDVSYVQRFLREAKLASAMSDKHVVRILDYGASRDTHYLVMEYILGENLSEVVKKRGPLPWEEAIELLDQLAAGLEHAHALGVIHRDIKPHNMMLTPEGVLKILDFGIARGRALPSLTQSGFVGSPYYISPEQAMGEEVDIRSDIYSSGIVLYEMLAGRVPFDAKSPWSIISQHIASEPPPLDTIAGRVPEQVEQILRLMVAKRPEDRFQTPTALREAIKAALMGEPISADIAKPPPISPDRAAMAQDLYQRAIEAVDEEEWQRAVELLNQVLKLNPEHTSASLKLVEAGKKARIIALYEAASKALEANRWDEAVEELNEVVSIDSEYRDASELLTEARAALSKADLRKRVTALYEDGLKHMENKAWQEALRNFSRVQELSPGYKETPQLLKKAEKKSRPGPLKRLVASMTYRGMAVVILIAALIGGGMWAAANQPTSQYPTSIPTATVTLVPTNTPAPTYNGSEDPLLETYEAAKQAIEEENWQKAILLLEEVLAEDPKYKAAATMRQMAMEQMTLTQIDTVFKIAQEARQNKQWKKSIELLEQIRATDPLYNSTEVDTMLCDSYYNQGLYLISDLQDPTDRDLYRQAQGNFDKGLEICQNDEGLKKAKKGLDAMQQSVKHNENQEWEETVSKLKPVLDDIPGFGGEAAKEMLYRAYIGLGNNYLWAGEFNSALIEYNNAIALNPEDPSEAESKRESTLKRIEEINATPTPTPTATPINPNTYPSPELVSPEDGAYFGGGKLEVIVLEWEPMNLGPDEYYDVTVRTIFADEFKYWGSGELYNTTEWQVPAEAGYGVAGNDTFDWWVTIRKAGTAGAEGVDQPLSPPSEQRTFIWK